MFQFIQNFYNYSQLIYSVYHYLQFYNERKEHNIIHLDSIIQKIKKCGSVAIKFTQWITPKLEVMHLEENQIIKNDKPLWLKKLEIFYENCDEHSIEYTMNHYQEVFHTNFHNEYEILDTIGSGSVGQVYLIQNKPLTQYSKKKKYVMKILHPNISYEINFFRKFYTFIQYIPQVKQLIRNNLPFDIYSFINQFNEQSNFMNESNHLLQFKEYYQNNNFIIIPELIRCSESILVMSYEEGISFDELTIDSYHKSKIALLLVSFLRNNQHILNYHHGDLHKGNWKVRLSDDNNHKLVLYDYGFCWKVSHHKIQGINTITEIFEDSDINPESINIEKMTDVCKYLIQYNTQNETIIHQIIKNYLKNNINLIKPWVLNPSRLFKMVVQLCISENLMIDPTLIQTIIILIQCQKIFEEFKITSSDNDNILSYEVFRSRYLDWLTFYKTNHIFIEYSKFITNLLNQKQTEINSIFDCVEMPNCIQELALKK